MQDFLTAQTGAPAVMRMPTRQALLSAGRKDLVSAIETDGGFLEVSQLLDLPSRRRPNGFWDNLEALDQVFSV